MAAAGAFGAAAQQMELDVQQMQLDVQQLKQDAQQLTQGMQQLQLGQQQMQQMQQQILAQLALLNPNAIALAAQGARAANLTAAAGTPLALVPCANGAPPAAWPPAGASRARVTAGMPIGVVDAVLANYDLPVVGGAAARRQALLSHLGAVMR
jgi:hypothetical protein